MASTSVIDGVIAEFDAGVAWLRIDREDRRNALDLLAVRRLTGLLARADRDHRVRCIVLTGTGRDFCTGGDLTPLAGTDGGAAQAGPADPWTGAPAPDGEPLLDYRWPLVPFHELFRTLWETETPVVSAVNGTVAGIGWMLALLADFVVAVENAGWTHAFVRRGMMPHAGDTVFLPRVIPLHRLTQLAMLSDRVTSEVLLEWGLLYEVVPADDLQARAGELAGRLAAGPTMSFGQAKRMYRRSLLADVEGALAEERATTALVSATRDRQEGSDAFLEGRAPGFTGV